MKSLKRSELSRRDVLKQSMLLAAAMAAINHGSAWAATSESPAPPSNPKLASGFTEKIVLRDNHRIYVRDYPGKEPAYVLLHGFPDNCRIYEDLAPRLSAAGRRVIAFDFLGFGASDKPTNFRYDFEQQLADFNAVVNDLKLNSVIPVGHDAGGRQRSTSHWIIRIAWTRLFCSIVITPTPQCWPFPTSLNCAAIRKPNFWPTR